MFRLDVLENQWLVLALVGGAALVCVFWLVYQSRWLVRERRQEEEAAGHETQRLPRFLLVVYVLIAVFVVLFTVLMIARPPNW